ncbi:type VI secretion system baseplate subunit TssF [Sandaracinobacteroides saxicola]|uniref:Type VI secretion system baseplate subunit TssF n=1 Tax=Sandaracinobacteroides saxicola TaxID=2759707 RepID=A0A7G5IJ10_9SPHN|nr:type VI secretion system baseplate subunit TssF [Sandaracinobacteroides saxicola]QMW23352.1 type VI secretion system baseplate subunit TssF [Sandaracinobacteroides saxicola]
MTAVDPRLLGHYNRELTYLRRRAAEFSQDHRQVAGLLGLDAPTDPDPHVERLMEGVAFLNARVRLKLDEQFPLFTQYLLDALYPHYLAPTPAMGIVAIRPKAGDETPADGVRHAKGSALFASLAGDATQPVQFTTGADVQLWPLTVATADYLPTRAAVAAAAGDAQAEAGLRIRIEATSAVPLSAIPVETLPLFLDGGGDTPNLLYQQMLSECVGVRVVAPERGRKASWSEQAGPVEPMGYGAEEALLPADARAFGGYRLLAEYFAMPEKFRFARLTGLRAGFARAERALDIVLLFRRSVPALAGAVAADTLVPFAAPVINLFERRFDRVLVDGRQVESIVLPDRTAPLDYEVYRLDQVTGFASEDVTGTPALPLYARRVERGEKPLFYALRRRLRRLSDAEARKRREGDYIGTENWISLSSPGDPGLARSIMEIGVRGLVTNRALATRLRPGAATLELSMQDSKGVGGIAFLRGPTKPMPPMGLSDGAWRIVSHIAPANDGFVRPDGSPATLADHLSLYLRDESPVLRREIQGLTGLTSRLVTRRAGDVSRLAFQRGQRLTLGVAMQSYEASTAFLFTSVVARFLGDYATVNSFAECEVKADNGLSWDWGTWAGRRPTI